jgi:membrane protease YdiL (CAAX protease family)
VFAAGAFYAAFIVVAIGAEWAQALVAGPGSWWRTAGRGLIGLAAPPLVAVGLVYGGLVWGAGERPETWGLPSWRLALAGAGRGLGWGAGLAAATILLCLAGGAGLRWQSGGDERLLAVAAPLAAGLAGAAVLEELLFRGFPLSRLARGLGRVVAAVVLAVVFAWAHLRNPAVSGIGLANIGLASLLLAAAFLTAGGLGTAVGLHLGWNAGLVFGADAPVSGLRFGLPGLEFAPGPREWWTGGSFGPEGGLAATIVLGIALAWWTRAAALAGGQRERGAAA